MAPQQPSPALFFDTISAYSTDRALRAAIEQLVLTPGGGAADGLRAGRRRAQATPRGIRILADYLTILGFLQKQGDQYELTLDTKVFLDRSSPAYVGDAAQFMLAPQLREGFLQLTRGPAGRYAISDEGTVSATIQPGWNSPAASSAHADAGPVACGLGRREHWATASRARRRRGTWVIRPRDRRTLSPSPCHRARLVERAGGRGGECASGRGGRSLRLASWQQLSTWTGVARTTSCS